jgi:transposase-like protein
MIDFPIEVLLDDSICTVWLEHRLHPRGLRCPHGGHSERRLFREQGRSPAYRCRACDGYYTLLTGTVFAKTRQRPATLVLLLRGIDKGEPTERLARELGLSRKQLHTLRQRIQANLNATALTGRMAGTSFEADELYQNAGEKSTPHPHPFDPPRRRANRRKGHGIYANDRPPIMRVVSRETGEQRLWVCDHADMGTCHALIVENVPAGGTMLSTDEWQSYHDSHPAHAHRAPWPLRMGTG